MAQLTSTPQRCPVAYQAQHQPHTIALLQRNLDAPSTHWSYQQLHLAIADKQRWLLNHGAKPGQHLAVLSHDKIELVQLLFAALRLGVVFIPINPAFSAAQQQQFIERADADYLFTNDTRLKIPNDCKQLPSEMMVKPATISPGTSQSAVTPCDQHLIDTSLPLTGLFTSGSTGNPKLAIHSFENHIASAQASRQLIELNEDDGWGMTLPLYHIGGMAIVFRTVLTGACLIVPADEPLSQLLCEPRLTHLSAVSTQLLQLRQQLENQNNSLADFALKTLLLGGSSIPASLIQWLTQPASPSVPQSAPKNISKPTAQAKQEHSPLHCFISYGLTEMASQVMTGPINADSELAQRLAHCQLLLSDDGEILIKGGSLLLGYYQHRRIQPAVDEQGWFHSRDLGVFNRSGGLTITGRLDNQFISGGENIQPEQIEAKIRQLAGVSDATVVPVNDPVYGQRPAAFIVTGQDQQKQNRNRAEENEDRDIPAKQSETIILKPLLTNAIENSLRQQLAGYQLPRLYLAMPEQLKTLKPDRRQLSAIADAYYRQRLAKQTEIKQTRK